MKTTDKFLSAVLILSAFIPMPVAIASLFHQESAIQVFNFQALTQDLEKVLLVSGAYMLSFILLFLIAAVQMVFARADGLMLSIILGIITLIRGILMLTAFSVHHLEMNVVAVVATIDGALIIFLNCLARRN
jgi:hypothetical protein